MAQCRCACQSRLKINDCTTSVYSDSHGGNGMRSREEKSREFHDAIAHKNFCSLGELTYLTIKKDENIHLNIGQWKYIC